MIHRIVQVGKTCLPYVRQYREEIYLCHSRTLHLHRVCMRLSGRATSRRSWGRWIRTSSGTSLPPLAILMEECIEGQMELPVKYLPSFPCCTRNSSLSPRSLLMLGTR